MTASLSRALESTIARCGGMIRRVGSRHGLSGADVDELLQEVRIRLWRARETGESIESAPTSYVYQTARSAALDLIRRRRARREEPLAVSVSRPEPPARRTASPESAVEESELVQEIERAVDGIAPSRRPVVRMYLVGYSREEIADLMGWSEAKTRNLLYRGLADLRERLTERRAVSEAVR